MASITHGMNVEVVRGTIAPGLDRQAALIEQAITVLDRLIQQAEENWKGNDSRQFASKWQGDYRGKLHSLANELKALSSTARRNAGTQDSTSSSL